MKKMITILGLMLISSTSSLSEANITPRNQISINEEGYHYQLCAVVKGKVKCWGSGTFAKSAIPDSLKNVTQIGASFGHMCALAEKKVTCWGPYYPYKKDEVPSHEEASDLSLASGTSCAIFKNAVKCWGRYNGTVPDLKNPRQVTVSDTLDAMGCALTDEGIKCWSWLSDQYPATEKIRLLSVPSSINQNVKMVTANSGIMFGMYSGVTKDYKIGPFCALSSSRINCWNDRGLLASDPGVLDYYFRRCLIDRSAGFMTVCGSNEPKSGHGFLLPAHIPPKNLEDIKYYDIGFNLGCALTFDGKVKCWGSAASLAKDIENSMPKLVNPTSIAVGEKFACVIDEESLKCWGRGTCIGSHCSRETIRGKDL